MSMFDIDRISELGFSAALICDSISKPGIRVSTFELTYPRFVHAELMTHRVFSRNSASSRAIPSKKLMERVRKNPAMPLWWGANQSGMQARKELVGWDKSVAMSIWLEARESALRYAERLEKIGLHKQIANRIIEPWMFITVLVTSTEWSNWYKLRDHKDAQPEIAWVAAAMRDLHEGNSPRYLSPGQWHLPLVDDGEARTFGPSELVQISTGRCARVSYLTHDGQRDPMKDIELCHTLRGNGHWSPFEHPCMALAEPERHGNFVGWLQYRKNFKDEAGGSFQCK